MDEFNQIYEDWIDDINSRPLTTSRFTEYNDVIQMNQQIISRIYSIRRHLEMSDVDDDVFDRNAFDTQVRNAFDTQQVRNAFDRNVFDRNAFGMNSITGNGNLFTTGIMTNLFSMLLQGVHDVNTDNLEDVKVTLTQDQFDTLFSEKITLDNINGYNTSQCNICMDEYTVDNIIVKLECNHVFHKDCIQHWLCNERVTCPVCRKDTRETLISRNH